MVKSKRAGCQAAWYSRDKKSKEKNIKLRDTKVPRLLEDKSKEVVAKEKYFKLQVEQTLLNILASMIDPECLESFWIGYTWDYIG